MSVQTWRSHEPFEGHSYEGAVSLTVPDQTHTIKEIVEQFTRSGVEIPQKDMIFLGEEEVPDWEFMSRIDRLQAASVLRMTVASRKAELKKLEEAGEEVPQERYPDLSPPAEIPDTEKEDGFDS